VGCRARTGKASLVRVVSSGAGLAVDRHGSAPGRGAYVHPDKPCVRAAVAQGALARALRTGVRSEEVGRLMLEIERIGAA
jgi:uncharacterized protein